METESHLRAERYYGCHGQLGCDWYTDGDIAGSVPIQSVIMVMFGKLRLFHTFVCHMMIIKVRENCIA